MHHLVRDGEPFCMATLVARASVRQLRLHACGCMRLSVPKRTPWEFLRLIEVAERYADGEVGEAELEAARKATPKGPRPRNWRGDFTWAFQADEQLQSTWASTVRENQTFKPNRRDYHRALPRHRVFEELLGPDPRPDFPASWRTDTAVQLAKQMYDAREFSAMPILADALQDAGCDNDDILAHCRNATILSREPPTGSPAPPPVSHVRGCWVTDLVLGKS